MTVSEFGNDQKVFYCWSQATFCDLDHRHRRRRPHHLIRADVLWRRRTGREVMTSLITSLIPPVADFLKHVTIVIYGCRVVATRNFLPVRLIYNPRSTQNVSTTVPEQLVE